MHRHPGVVSHNSFIRFPWYVLLLAVYPVIALMAANIKEIEPWVVIRPLAFVVLAAALLMGGLTWLLKDFQRAALAAAFLLLLFFSYGHLYYSFRAAPSVLHLLGQHRILAGLYLTAGILGLWLILRRVRHPAEWAAVLNASSLVLVVLAMGQMGLYAWKAARAEVEPVQVSNLHVQASSSSPDIYYIILDLYTRADVLEQDYGFDNRPFLESLKELGFQTAVCASSNYGGTELSLASSLNMEYLDRFGGDFRTSGESNALLPGLIKDGRVRQIFEELGYQSIAFETGYYWSQWMDADIYLTPPANPAFQQLRPFELLLLKSSAALAALDAGVKLRQEWAVSADIPYSEHIRRERFLLDKLGNLSGLAARKLVFAHILIPHNPQIFAPDGSIRQDPRFWSNGESPINEELFREGYTSQVAYINSRILEIVKSIQASSNNPPVIIIQGDHGVRSPHRHAILNSYYLPGAPEGAVSDTLSPVNSFRLVLNMYFGANLPLLPDRIYNLDEKTGKWVERTESCTPVDP